MIQWKKTNWKKIVWKEVHIDKSHNFSDEIKGLQETEMQKICFKNTVRNGFDTESDVYLYIF